MRDLRSFLRYLAPGISFFIECGLILFLLDGHRVWDWLGPLHSESALIGVVFGGVIVLNGFGYLFSIVHHAIYNTYFGECFYAGQDFRQFLRRCVDAKVLCLEVRPGPSRAAKTSLSREGAWRIVMALLYTRMKGSKRLKGVIESAEQLTNLMHGMGTTLVGSVFAFVLAVWIAFPFSIHWGVLIPIVFWLALLFIHCKAYSHTSRQAQYFVELVLFEDLLEAPNRAYPIGERELIGEKSSCVCRWLSTIKRCLKRNDV